MSDVEAYEAFASKSRMDILTHLYQQDMDIEELAKRSARTYCAWHGQSQSN